MAKVVSLILLLFALVVCSAPETCAQTTQFTYQGNLRDGAAPATGNYDFEFLLFDLLAGGTQIGSTVSLNGVAVSNGAFAVNLDFGSQFPGANRFLEIHVRPTGGGPFFTLLTPRQLVTSVPYSVQSLNAANATQLNGQLPAFYQNAANLSSGTLPDARLSGAYTGALTLSNAGNAFTGSGAGLTGLNASSLASGALADARLSTNVALLGGAQTFTGAKTFSLAPSFTAAGAPFSVSNSTLVTNLNADRLDGLDSSAFLQSLPNPLTLSGTSVSHIIKGENASTVVFASGVFGSATGGTGVTFGVFGQSASTGGSGVAGLATAASGTTYGGNFQSDSTSGRGVYGVASAASGTTYGGRFESDSTAGRGVYGSATASSGSNYGGYFQSNSTSGRGVFGTADAASGTTYGVYGQNESTSGRGVLGVAAAGTGTTYGVYGHSNSTSGRAVYGVVPAASGATYGVYGLSSSTEGTGVFGQAIAASGFTYGGRFQSDSTDGRGIYGLATAATGDAYGGLFESNSTSGKSVVGRAGADTGLTYGVYGYTLSTGGRGVLGWATAATGNTMGVRGVAASGSGYGVYSVGDMGATGTKPFRIDHPDDPENKYLLHYATESPEVINFYRGTVVLDGTGEAVVELPHYFAKINKTPSYTLTAVGAPMPMLHVAQEIDEAAMSVGAKAGPGDAAPKCSFRIAGGAPGAKVSWRVEAVRYDLWVRTHGKQVEVEKQGPEKGTYQHPELYGQPKEKGMDYDAARESAKPVRP